jgi:hypothetical protein
MLHRILFKTSWFFHAETPNEHCQSRNNAEAEGETPYSTKMVLSKTKGNVSD